MIGATGHTIGDASGDAPDARRAIDDLARRDRGIPGLAVLLDDRALSDALGRPVSITRVRYKPGTSILAAFTAADGADGDGWAAAYDGPDKVRPKSSRRGDVTLLAGVEHAATGPVLTDRALRAAVREAERADPGLLVGATVVRHNPGRRLVLADASRVTKLYAAEPPDPARLGDLLRDHGVPVLPQTRLGGHVWSAPRWGIGDLSERPAATAARAARGAGAALARLHRVPAPPEIRALDPQRDAGADARAAARAIEAVLPHLGDRAHRVAADVQRLDGHGPAASVLVHGDFSADQVLVDAADDVRIIDFDRVAHGDPARDLASYAVDATLRGAGFAFGDLLGGYAAEGGAAAVAVAASWQRWVPACALGRAIEPFRRCLPDWPQHVERALALAEGGMP